MTSENALTWANARNIAIVRLDNAGDLLMSTPAIQAIKMASQEAKITVITSPSGASAADLVPEVDAVMTVSVPWMKSFGRRLDPAHLQDAAISIATRDFDAAVIMTVFSQSAAPAAMLLYLAGVPLRLAYSHEKIYALLTDWVKDPEPQQFVRHEVQRGLDLVATVGFRAETHGLSLRPTHHGREQASHLLERFQIRDDKWFVVHPGASQAIRRFPIPALAEAVREVMQRSGYRAIITGSQDEAALAEELAELCPGSINAAATTDFDGLCALIEMSALVITNNTGTSHVAAALQRPSVVLYARTNPQHTPWQAPATVLYFDFTPCQIQCTHDVCAENRSRLRLPSAPDIASCALHRLGLAEAPRLPSEVTDF